MVTHSSPHLNLETLDELVLECLDVYSSKEGRLSEEVRSPILAGDIQQALVLLERVCPQALQDLRLVFRLQRQQFIELVRNARHSSADDILAITCAKDQLAPLALDAYPEAYCDFKRMLTLLLYAKTPEPEQPQDVRAALEPGARQELAQQVDHTVRMHTGHQEPLLSLLLLYLLRLYIIRPSTTAAEQEVEKLADALFGMGRDAAPLPPESLGPSSFNEHDVNALVHCAGCTRRDAVAALKRTNNDLLSAFKAELARLRLNKPLLLELLDEYVVFRGLSVTAPQHGRDSCDHTSGAACTAGGKARTTSLPGSVNVGAQRGEGAMDVDGPPVCVEIPECGGVRGAEGRGRGGSMRQQNGAGAGAESSGCDLRQQPEMQQQQGQEAQPSTRDKEAEATEGIGRLTVDGAGQMVWQSGGVGGGAADGGKRGDTVLSVRQSAPRRSESQSPPGKVQRCHTGARNSTLPWPKLGSQDEGMDSSNNGILTVLQLAKDNKPAEMHDAIEVIVPGFFAEHPTLLFELRRCQLAQQLESGDVSGALVMARTQLAPIADKETSLQPLLKSVMAGFLPLGPAAAAPQQPSLPALTSSIQAALMPRLGMEGPRLIKLMQALLAQHRAWTKHEKYSDPFLVDMHIDALRQPHMATVLAGSSRGDAAAGSVHRADPLVPGSVERGPPSTVDTVLSEVSDDLSEDLSLDGGGVVNEESVLRLIEILEVPRHEAIELLAQHEGNIEEAVVTYAAL